MNENESTPVLGDGRYEVQSKLGEGGHAVVYRVVDTRLGVARAMKVLHPASAKRAKLRARFEQEARTMAQLDHPHVVRVYDVVTTGPVAFLVMEFVAGGSLAGWLEAHGPMPPRLAASCVREAALGAGAAHGLGVIHRDIKPHNILVSRNGTCMLTDFGIAQVAESSRTKSGAVMGTHGYMAPEQARDASSVDERVDVFSLGMTLFVLLTNADPMERLAGRGLDQVAEPLRALVESATAFDRSRRHADVAAFVAALDAALPLLTDPPSTPALQLPESFGTALDAEESSTLREASTGGGAGSNTSEHPAPRPSTPPSSAPASAGTPRPLPYRVPAQVERSDTTPDYVDRSVGFAPPPGPITVDAPPSQSGAEPSVHSQTPGVAEQEPVGLGGAELASEGGRFVKQLLEKFLVLLLDPFRVAGPVALLVVFFVAIPYFATRELRGTAREARAASAQIATLITAGDAQSAVVALGGDGATLEKLRQAWSETTVEPERTVAAQRYLDALDNEARRYLVPGMPASDQARVEIQRLREAVVLRKERVHAFETRRDGLTGCAAIGVTPP